MNKEFKIHDAVVAARDMVDVLPKNSIGIILCVYSTEPTSYEVLFNKDTANEISVWVEQDEIERYKQ